MLSKKHPARVYADAVVAKKINAPKYVVKQCKKFNKIANNRDKRYRINEDRVDLIDGMLDLMIMPKGLAIGKTIKEAMAGFQWLFIIAVSVSYTHLTAERRGRRNNGRMHRKDARVRQKSYMKRENKKQGGLTMNTININGITYVPVEELLSLIHIYGLSDADLHVYSCRRPAEEKRGITGS